MFVVFTKTGRAPVVGSSMQTKSSMYFSERGYLVTNLVWTWEGEEIKVCLLILGSETMSINLIRKKKKILQYKRAQFKHKFKYKEQQNAFDLWNKIIKHVKTSTQITKSPR